MTPIVQKSPAIVDKTKENKEAEARIREQVKAKFKSDQEKFNEMKSTIEKKVSARPLLVEQGNFLILCTVSFNIKT